MSDLERLSDVLDSTPGVVFSRTSLQLPPEISWAALERIVQGLRALGESLPWLEGDAMVQAEARFPTTWAQLVPGDRRAQKTTWNRTAIAKAVPPDVRREDVSHSHHAEVAFVRGDDRETKKEKQRRLLASAAENGWTKSELRGFVRTGELPASGKSESSIREQLHEAARLAWIGSKPLDDQTAEGLLGQPHGYAVPAAVIKELGRLAGQAVEPDVVEGEGRRVDHEEPSPNGDDPAHARARVLDLDLSSRREKEDLEQGSPKGEEGKGDPAPDEVVPESFSEEELGKEEAQALRELVAHVGGNGTLFRRWAYRYGTLWAQAFRNIRAGIEEQQRAGEITSRDGVLKRAEERLEALLAICTEAPEDEETGEDSSWDAIFELHDELRDFADDRERKQSRARFRDEFECVPVEDIRAEIEHLRQNHERMKTDHAVMFKRLQKRKAELEREGRLTESVW